MATLEGDRDVGTQVLGKKGRYATEGSTPVQTLTGSLPILMWPSSTSPVPTCLHLTPLDRWGKAGCAS